MARVHGIEGMTDEEITLAVQDGARFVMFEYCISIIILTFKRPTGVYFIPAGRSAIPYALPWVTLSLVLGWWGIPWGPIYTIGSTFTNLNGGHEVTDHFFA